jgi:hypothetical protein
VVAAIVMVVAALVVFLIINKEDTKSPPPKERPMQDSCNDSISVSSDSLREGGKKIDNSADKTQKDEKK